EKLAAERRSTLGGFLCHLFRLLNGEQNGRLRGHQTRQSCHHFAGKVEVERLYTRHKCKTLLRDRCQGQVHDRQLALFNCAEKVVDGQLATRELYEEGLLGHGVSVARDLPEERL